MKVFIISISFLLEAVLCFGQTAEDTLVVAPGTSGLYFYHIVENGENLQTIASHYDLSPAKLAKLNSVQKNAALKPFQMVKVPVNNKNLVQSGNPTASKHLKPLYHKVLKGETLYRIGKIYGDVPLASVKTWNHLGGNTVKAGQYLIVGWLKTHSGKTTTPIAKTTIQPPEQKRKTEDKKSAKTPTPSSENNTAEKQSTAPASSNGSVASAGGDHFLNEVISSEKNRVRKTAKKVSERQPVSSPLIDYTSPKSTVENTNIETTNKENVAVSKPLISEAPSGVEKKMPTEPVAKAQTPKAPEPKPAAPNNKGEKDQKVLKDNPFEKMLNKVTHKPAPSQKPIPQSKPEIPTSEPIQEAVPDSSVIKTNPVLSTGLQPNADSLSDAPLELAQKSQFSELYLAQTQDETVVSHKKGAAGWFKSNVQPGSKKYYALCNDLPRGTIVKVINPINKKYVYVKVLSSIPEQKENYNLIIKLSDAAMQDLGTNQPRFWSEIVYPKVKGSNK